MGRPWWKYEPRPTSQFRFTMAALLAVLAAAQFGMNYRLAAGMAVVSVLHLWLGLRDRRRERTLLSEPGREAEG